MAAGDLQKVMDDLYQQSDRLSEKSWKTKRWTEFQALCDPATADEHRQRCLSALKRDLESAWARYSTVQVAERERTAENMAGHRLLVEGLAGWLESVELCEQGEYEAALEAAQEANRLLVLVQFHAKRVREAALGN